MHTCTIMHNDANCTTLAAHDAAFVHNTESQTNASCPQVTKHIHLYTSYACKIRYNILYMCY